MKTTTCIIGTLFIATIFSCAKTEAEEESRTPVIQSTEVNYSADSLNFRGWIAWDTTIHEKRPGVIVVHEWWGHNDFARDRARMLAKEGYTAFAIDMFGDGKTANHPDSALAFVHQALATAEGTQSRFDKAVEVLKDHPTVDANKISATGYCFGGTVVLEMARAGADLDGVVSYHGGLDTYHPAQPGAVKARMLVCTGSADPMVPEEQVKGFESEMSAAKADFEVVRYPDAKHAFTNPAADSLSKEFNLPLAYNLHADTSSWNKTMEFLADLYNR